MFDGSIDYATYSLRDLREAEQSIDRVAFPINAARLDAEILVRGNQPMPPVERPRAEPAATLVPLRAKRAIWLYIAYFLVQLGVGLIGGIAVGIYAIGHFGSEADAKAFIEGVAIFPITIACVLAGGGVVFAIVRSSFEGRARDGAFASVGWKATPLFSAVVAAFIGAAIAWVYLQVTTSFGAPSAELELGPLTKAAMAASAVEGTRWALLIWGVLALVVVPVEEFLFRGVMLAGFQRSFGTVIAGFLVTIIFVATHLFETKLYVPAILAIATMAVGTLIARLKTGSLVAPICLHGAYNLVIVIRTFS